MPPTPESVADVASAIELALAPVFLLTGIAGMLNVMTNRLSRIIDRVRVLTEGERPVAAAELDSVAAELESLERRRNFAGTAITACTIAALLLCVVIATLFLEVMLNAPLNWLILRLLEKDPENRPSTAVALRSELDALSRELSNGNGQPISLRECLSV